MNKDVKNVNNKETAQVPPVVINPQDVVTKKSAQPPSLGAGGFPIGTLEGRARIGKCVNCSK